MSKQHPIIAITGSSGAGTSTVRVAMEHIFRRDGINGSVLNLDIVSSITEFYESIVIIDVIQSQRIGKKKLWF